MIKAMDFALAAASMLCASSANATFAVYTFKLDGYGVRTMQDRSGQSPNNGLTYAFLKSATIIIGADLSADGTVASGDDSLNQFEVRQVGSGYSFSFNPIELNGPFLATGSGATCPTCSAAYNTKAPRAGYGEDFDGVVSSFRVAFADSGRSFISFASVIPEPSTWALMLAGFGMVGYSLRRRRAAIAFA